MAAPEHVEELDAFQVGRLGLPDDLLHGVVRRGFGHEHRDVAADRRELRQRLEGTGGVPAREHQVEVQFGQQDGVAEVMLLRELGQELAHLAERLSAAEREGGGFEEERGALRARRVGYAAQAAVLGELFQDPLEVVQVAAGVAVGTAPEAGRARSGEGDGDAPTFLRTAVDQREDAPDLEEPDVAVLAGEVVPQGVEQPGQERRTQRVHVAAERVRQQDELRCDELRRGVVDQRLALRLVESESRQEAADLRELVADRVERMGPGGAPGRCGRDLVHAEEPRDLLDQVGLAFQVHAPRRHGPHAGPGRRDVGHRDQTEAREHPGLRLGRDLDAEQRGRLLMAEHDGLRFRRFGIGVHDAAGERAAGGPEDELGATASGAFAGLDVGTALESVAGVGSEPERLARPADVGRGEVGGFDEDVDGRVVDLGSLSAHDTGESDAFLAVGDQQVVGRERVFLAVEGGELLVRSGAADHDGRFAVVAAADETIVEGVERLAGLEHHVVRDVDDVVDAAETDLLERGAQPIGAGPDLHALHDASGVARAEVRRLQPHGDEVRDVLGAGGGRRQLGGRDPERVAGHGGDLAGDADEGVEVRSVGSDLEVVHDVAAGAAEMLGERLAHLGVGREDQQAVHDLGQSQLGRRAHHSVRLDAADLADLDGERFLVAGLRRERCAGEDERDLVAGLEILGAADDLPLAGAVGHAADGELVGVRMLVAGQHLRDDDAGELPADLLHAFDLEAEHREPFGEFFGRPIESDVALEPVQGDLHVLDGTEDNHDPIPVNMDLPKLGHRRLRTAEAGGRSTGRRLAPKVPIRQTVTSGGGFRGHGRRRRVPPGCTPFRAEGRDDRGLGQTGLHDEVEVAPFPAVIRLERGRPEDIGDERQVETEQDRAVEEKGVALPPLGVAGELPLARSRRERQVRVAADVDAVP